MPFSSKLPPDYVWQEDGEQHTLYLGDVALVRIKPLGAGWIAQILLEAPGIVRQQIAVRRVEFGKGWAARWVMQRQRVVANACGRPDLAPPVVHGPVRRSYAWQAPSWAKAG